VAPVRTIDGPATGLTQVLGVTVVGGLVRPFPATTVTGSVPGSVTVKPGQSVLVNNAQVAGGITVQPGGSLTITNSTVNAAIVSNGATSFTACGSALRGSVTVNGSTGPGPHRGCG
jgi:hypothetical protein